MPSLKSHIVALVLKHTRKKAFATAADMNRWIAMARRTQSHRPPAAIAKRLAVAERAIGGFPVYEIVPRQGVTSRRRILFLHGGAYCFEITRYHWNLIAEMAERLGACITVPIYPLAPEHDFHAIFGMTMDVYEILLQEAASDEIVFMGDSAGGNMAVVLTMMAAERGLDLPGRHVLISPGLDLSLRNATVYEIEKRDPLLGIAGGLEAMRHYSAGLEPTDWRISPVFGDLTVLPPTLILTGTRDLLYPDTVSFAEKAQAAGVDVRLVVEPGMFHVWPLIDMPEARRARDVIVDFLTLAKDGRHPAAASHTRDLTPVIHTVSRA